MHGAARATLSVIGGPPGPIAVHQVSQGGSVSPALANLCGESPDVLLANPSPRLAALTQSFRSRGQLHSSCAPSHAPALVAIVKRIERSLGVGCLDDAVEVADCISHDVADGVRVEIPRCPATADCFDIVPDTARCGGGLRVTIERKTTPPPTAHVEVACAPH